MENDGVLELSDNAYLTNSGNSTDDFRYLDNDGDIVASGDARIVNSDLIKVRHGARAQPKLPRIPRRAPVCRAMPIITPFAFL